jgi:hypothetical protein
LNDKPTIPDELSDLIQDATHRTVTDAEKTAWGNKTTVSWNQQISTGQQIATITIDGTTTNVFAPTGGGGGGGGNVDSVNGKEGRVILELGDMDDANFTGLDNNHVPIYDATDQEWQNAELASVALSGSYNDLSNKPTIPAAQVNSDWNAASGVAQILNKPTIPAAQIQSDWNQSDTTAKDYIKNKPTQLGHHMIPNTSLISSMAVAVTDVTNDDVVSAYGVGTWSNVTEVTYYIHGTVSDSPIGTTGIGDWDDTTTYDGWLEIGDLYGINSDMQRSVKVQIDPATFADAPATFGGWRIEDNATDSLGNPCGKICIKFSNTISDADRQTAVVGVKIITERAAVSEISLN